MQKDGDGKVFICEQSLVTKEVTSRSIKVYKVHFVVLKIKPYHYGVSEKPVTREISRNPQG